MRSRVEMRNMLLETEGKVSLVTKAENLAELCSCASISWKAELPSNETGCLARALSKQYVEGTTWLLLTAYSAM